MAPPDPPLAGVGRLRRPRTKPAKGVEVSLCDEEMGVVGDVEMCMNWSDPVSHCVSELHLNGELRALRRPKSGGCMQL